ncbi:MAG: lysophospholipid acyltransferase family protein [Opitutae bacterium]
MSTPSSDQPENPVNAAWYHWIWVFPLALFFRLWLATLRIQSNFKPQIDEAGPVIIMLWHERLFISPLISQNFLGRPVTALISTSRDGGWLVAFFKIMGLHAVRGSSSKRGASALIELTRNVKDGRNAGVTPDGPKGPRRVCKPGAVALAKITRRPFLLLGINFHRAIKLKSWDQFSIPLPFSKVDIHFETVACPQREENDEEVALRIQNRLNEISGV